MNNTLTDSEAVRETVRQGYAKIANDTSSGRGSPGVSCCGSSPHDSEKLAKELLHLKSILVIQGPRAPLSPFGEKKGRSVVPLPNF